MKLYKWYKDKVESVEVIKETPKMYTIKSHKIAFGYRTKIYKEGTFHTEKEALEEKQYELLERIKKIKIQLHDAQEELKMTKEYKCDE